MKGGGCAKKTQRKQEQKDVLRLLENIRFIFHIIIKDKKMWN